MFRHLLKLIWKRKSRNLMLSLEILIAFVLVFAIAGFAARNYQLYQLPVGFKHDNVWSVSFQKAQMNHGPGHARHGAMYDALERGVRAMPEVEYTAFTGFAPFTNSSMVGDFMLPDKSNRIHASMVFASDDYYRVLGIELAQGRWFNRADEGVQATPVVINRRMAQSMFGGAALGKVYAADVRDGEVGDLFKVVGVVDEYRHQGEFQAIKNFSAIRYATSSKNMEIDTMLLRLKPGTPRAFAAKLNAELKRINPDWGYEITPLAELRESHLRNQLIPLMILSVIAGFLLVMVAFGLFGVLWQNTTQRIPEIGLRRAIGAGAGHIYRQIVAEQMLLSTFAMGAALVLLVQLPITGALGEHLNWTVFGAASALSMATIYLLSLVCSLYPGWRASRLSPTEALHYE